jgi:hypothetical protein
MSRTISRSAVGHQTRKEEQKKKQRQFPLQTNCRESWMGF